MFEDDWVEESGCEFKDFEKIIQNYRNSLSAYKMAPKSRKSIHGEKNKTKTGFVRKSVSPPHTHSRTLPSAYRTLSKQQEISSSEDSTEEGQELLQGTDELDLVKDAQKDRFVPEAAKSKNVKCHIHSNKELYPNYSKPITDYTKKKNYVDEDKSQKGNNTAMFILIPAALVLIVAVIYIKMSSTSKNEFNLVKNMEDLNLSYPSQSKEIWTHLLIGLETIKNLSRSSVFMLAHHNKEQIAVEMVNKLGLAATTYLNDGNSDVRPTTVFDSDLHLKDHAELLRKYKSELEQNRVMVVHGIERVPGVVAQGFRYFCDEYTPMVEKSAMFFTINLDKCSTVVDKDKFVTANRRDIAVMIEDCLTDSWSSALDVDTIRPLLVRILGTVLKIT